MSEREDNVYKAKLAEQAERYDGEWISFRQDGTQPAKTRRITLILSLSLSLPLPLLSLPFFLSRVLRVNSRVRSRLTLPIAHADRQPSLDRACSRLLPVD